MNIKAGKLIIAKPFLGDPNFERTVVLLCQHQEEGTFGLVLNQKEELNLEDLVDLESLSQNFLAYRGGPVELDTLHFIHRLPQKLNGSIEILPGLFWGGDFEELKSYISEGLVATQDIRFFVGYSGWGQGQLAKEFKEDSWVLAEASSDLIFDTPAKELWREVLKQMGGENKILANYPIDPRLN